MRGEIRQIHPRKGGGSPGEPIPRRLAVIMAGDIAGYSRLMNIDEEGTHARLKRILREVVEPTIAEHHGRLVKTTGDGFIAIFDSPVEAVRCGIVIQQSMVGRNASVPAQQALLYRIGVNLGDVIVDSNEVFGDGVNIAVRLEGIATPGQVYISGGVYEQIKHKLVCGYQSLGDRQVKNITDPVRVYRVLPDPAAFMETQKRREIGFVVLASIVLLAIAGSLWYTMRPGRDLNVARSSAPAASAPETSRTTESAAAIAPSAAPAISPQGTSPASPQAGSFSPATPQGASPQPASPPSASPSVKEPEMAQLPGGSFSMGSNEDPSEKPVHQVAIKPFALSKFPVTVRQWNECAAANACEFTALGDENAPVTNVSWTDTKQYLGWLEQVTHKPYRLPSEAEWEYAARGGTQTKYWWGDQLQAGMANCKNCVAIASASADFPAKVGSFRPNPFGLYDMGGGVDQWVEDCWHRNYQGAPNDGSPWMDGDCVSHVIRSGSWKNDASYVRPANRDHYDTGVRYPTHGFRVALSP
ncbi:MAG: SUMF1/EgtB/PvdO family nonheme iron enzyme [Hyphomicrobiales bacterium]|nr:SUMF1/EgtB/PvdO family nonheme iron enzyme [Hyphomicrobiales bacterium]MBV9976587.1 SUMF1/EgtB/PvdO family nonheme iron enzyme [Hyphomicrobiales bacterium]